MKNSDIIRIGLDGGSNTPLEDENTHAAPQFWMGSNVRFELGFLFNGLIESVTNVSSVTLTVKDTTAKRGPALMSKTLASSQIDSTVDQTTWEDGTKQHCVFEFDHTETVLPMKSDTDTFWLVVSAILQGAKTSSPATLTHVGAEATFTAATPHDFTSGQTATIAGATPSAYNGVFTITVDSEYVFHYTMLSTPASDASGIITATVSNPHHMVLCADNITVNNAGQLVTTPVSVVQPTYLTADQSDARYASAIDNANLARAVAWIDDPTLVCEDDSLSYQLKVKLVNGVPTLRVIGP